MNKVIVNTILITLTTILLSSCATTPIVQVPQPWTRSMGDPQLIESNTNIYLNVIGEEKHLLLDNSLIDRNIHSIIENQLIRRNFSITENAQNADYTLAVNYSSKDVQVMRTAIATYQSASQQNYSRTGTGILAALAVGAQASQSETASKAETTSYTAYRHTLGLSISNMKDEVIWTGESTWESGNVDILGRIQTVSQILLSNLPGYGEVIPRVPAVNSSKEQNYYRLYISGNRFAGPALPYSINFDGSVSSRSVSQNVRIQGVSDPRILDAVIDLIQTAEYAVPRNPDYDDPISAQQWNRVKLGGKYYLGNDNQTSNILVELRGSRDGYTIRDASVVNQTAYNEFLDELSEWQNALWEYYDVFE